MLDILETYVKEQNYTYRRMDGTTPAATRSSLVDEFNSRDDIFIFLLTTKVGGLGLNLIGANKVIYSPYFIRSEMTIMSCLLDNHIRSGLEPDE